MSRPAPSTPVGPIDEDHLARLAEILEAAVPLAGDDPAQLVRLRAAPADDLADGELELGLRPIEGAHPLDDLVCFRAPDDWAAIGILARGRALGVDGAEAVRVRTVHLVARTGAWASRWAPLHAGAGNGAGEGGHDSSSGPGAATPHGRCDDALRRALGLATAPAPASTLRLWATQWLDALVAAAAVGSSGRRRLRPLAAVLGRHPAVDAFDLAPGELDLPGLVAHAERLASWRGWPQLRRACAGGLWPNPVVDAETAAWLDDGAFARWVLAAWPELDDLRDALGALLAPSAASVVDDALAGWGLLIPPRHDKG